MKKRLVFVVATALLACATMAFAGAGTSLNIDPEGKGDAAPDFRLKDVDSGQEIALSDYLGKKVVLLEFWATWCNICKLELPNLVKEYSEWKGKGYEILSITLSDGGARDVEMIREIKKKQNITWPVLIDERYETATKLYKLSGPIPLKLIVDCAGKLRYEHVGDYPPGQSEIPYVLEALLAEPSCKGK